MVEAARYLVGQDPTEIERHWQHLFRGPFRRGGPVLMSASAGVDMALWDIKVRPLRHTLSVRSVLAGAVSPRSDRVSVMLMVVWHGG